MILLDGLWAGAALLDLWIGLRLGQVFRGTPRLRTANPIDLSRLAVIVPAYNEAANVVDCLSSILESTAAPIEVWLVDDGSKDATWDLAKALAAERQDPRLRLLAGQPRPSDRHWVGKNWACAQAAERIQADHLLFLDCDVRLGSGAIQAALNYAQQQKAGLLSVGPEIVCGCLAEWLVQPIVLALLAVGYDLAAVNNPASDRAFAFGPFMLFRRDAYEAVGGHAGVAEEVVEDVELARRVKSSGLGLALASGTGFVSMRMYASGSQLWEGWTKNWFLGLGQSWALTWLTSALLVGSIALPWLGLLAGLIARQPLWILWGGLGVSLQLRIRLLLRGWLRQPLGYWWLAPLGGLVTAMIPLASAYRASTKRNWTWRGRPLG